MSMILRPELELQNTAKIAQRRHIRQRDSMYVAFSLLTLCQVSGSFKIKEPQFREIVSWNSLLIAPFLLMFSSSLLISVEERAYSKAREYVF